MQDQGFKLHYEDFDRGGTAGVSTALKAMSPEAAAQEARLFLAQASLPEQTKVSITHSFTLDVSDMNLGKKKT